MIGLIAGDVIGSPYRNNPRPDTASIFFPLFDSSARVEIVGRGARTYTYEARQGVPAALAQAAAEWYLDSAPERGWDDVAGRWLDGRRPSGSDFLAVCGPLLELSGGLDDALRHVGALTASMGLDGHDRDVAADFTRVLDAVRSGRPVADVDALLAGMGYDVARNCSELRPFVTGMVVQEAPGRLGMGNGKVVRDPAQVVPAAWAAVRESASYEEAVRRAVAVGGDSSLTASLAGAIAEMRWSVPEEIASRALDYGPSGGRALAARFERFRNGRGREELQEGEDPGRFQVIRVAGMGPVYVIPEDRQDIEDAVRRMNNARGLAISRGDYSVIRPDALDAEVERLSAQLDWSGKPLDGTYAEHPRPEVRTLWLQDGEVRTAYTRGGAGINGGKLQSKSVREATLVAFNALKAHAEEVRTELERRAGWDPSEGKGLPDFKAFLKDRLRDNPEYARALEAERTLLPEISALPGWDPVKGAVDVVAAEDFLRHSVGRAYGMTYGEAVSSRIQEEMNGINGTLHKEYLSRLQAKLVLLTNRTGDLPPKEMRSHKEEIRMVKDDMAMVSSFNYDPEVRFASLCKEKYGVEYGALVEKTRRECEEGVRAPFAATLDDDYKAYVYKADNLNLRYQEAKGNVDTLEMYFSGSEMLRLEAEYGNLGASLSGSHLHFASAFYPVVLADSIEIRQGDILRARVRVDGDGKFGVDTDAHTGGVHTEGLDGVLATMNIVSIPKPGKPGERPLSAESQMEIVGKALDAWCLDFGRIEDEKERKALEYDDSGEVYDESSAIRRMYKSNVERAQEDMAAFTGVAVMPAGPVLSEKAEAKRSERHAEGVLRYAESGVATRQEAVDSQAHKGSVFTVGHSNLTQEEFDYLLRRHGIEVLVDVRSFPKSKLCPHFDKAELKGHLEGNDIEYHHFTSLGGHRYAGEGEDRRQLSYEEILATKDFREDLMRVRRCAANGYRVALMCSENDPMDCHRMVLLGRALAHPEIYDRRLKPVDVQHITRGGYVLGQDYFERKMMRDYFPDVGGQGTLALDFSGGKDLLQEAYRKRGEALLDKGRDKGISLTRNKFAKDMKASSAKKPSGGYKRK